MGNQSTTNKENLSLSELLEKTLAKLKSLEKNYPTTKSDTPELVHARKQVQR